MRLLTFLLLTIFMCSCASEKPAFVKEKVCSNESLKYLRNPRNRDKRAIQNPQLIQDMAATTRSMQLCYEDFKNRTGHEEFNTCLVVGVDHYGDLEFYNFGSKEVRLDQAFLNCARAVTQNVSYSSYGSNYILIQSYQFFVGDL